MKARANTTLRRAFAVSGAGFGVFAVTMPARYVATYGMTSSPAIDVVVRLFGTRALALGVATLVADEPAMQRRMYTISTAMNLADVAVIAAAGNLPARSRLLGATTTAVFAALGGYLRSQS